MNRWRALGALDTASLLRWGILGIAFLGVAGTSAELLFLRHWQGTLQLIVWPVMVTLAIALALVVIRPTPRRLVIARVLAAIVLVFAGIGVLIHLNENIQSGYLDQDYAATWGTTGFIEQAWLAFTGSVGPAPTLAPAAIAWTALTVLLATIRHPADQ